jgi:hypothetical protein
MGIKIPKLIGVKLTGKLSGWVSQKMLSLKLPGFLPLKWNRAIVEYFEVQVTSMYWKRELWVSLLRKRAFSMKFMTSGRPTINTGLIRQQEVSTALIKRYPSREP